MQQRTEDARQTAATNQQNGSYLTGLVGALLGMLVGIIPNLLTIWFTDTIYSLLFALVPLAAMFGYRLFKGKSNAASIVIVILLSILSVGGMVFLLNAFYIMDEVGVSFGTALFLMRQNMEVADYLEMLGSFGNGFLFMALGIVVAWSYLSKTNSANVRGAEALLSTLRPNPAYAGYQQAAPQQEDYYAQPQQPAYYAPQQPTYYEPQQPAYNAPQQQDWTQN